MADVTASVTATTTVLDQEKFLAAKLQVAKQYLTPSRCSSRSVWASDCTIAHRSVRARDIADTTGHAVE